VDMAAVAYCIDPNWVSPEMMPSLGISDELKWINKKDAHSIREVYFVNRDKIFADFFKKVSSKRK
jgi:hypothetical protein